MQHTDLINILREGSSVQRCHTLPHHGEYSVGKHSYDAVMLLLTLNPEASKNLIKAVLVHDIAERWTGDMPGPAKWSDVELGRRLDNLERKCLKSIGWDILLTAEERIWLSTVDVIEFFLWTKEQLAMGNMNAAVIVGRLITQFKHMTIPKVARDFIDQHEWTRTPDTLPNQK